jgi:hypothetical protein
VLALPHGVGRIVNRRARPTAITAVSRETGGAIYPRAAESRLSC